MELFDIYSFEQHYKDGQCVFETPESTVSMLEEDDRYCIQTEQADPSMLCSLKSYFADTLSLMEEGQYLKWGNTTIGVWKKYDRSGDVQEEIDYDQGWKITWEKLIPYIQGQGIPMAGIVDIHRYERKKNEEEEDSESNLERVWEIGQITMAGDELLFLFDGNNGKLLETQKILAPNQ